jgi:hypothetical protein
MPASMTIPAQGFVVLFSSTITTSMTMSTLIRLVINGQLIDQVTVPPLAVNTSYARIPDGKTWYITTSPTIDEGNKLTTIAQTTPTAKATSTPTNHPKAPTHKHATPVQEHLSPPSSATSSTPSIPRSTPTILPQQPQWKFLHLFNATHAGTVTNPTIQAKPLPTTSNVLINTPTNALQKILITAFLLALLLSIWWNIRLFFLT